MRKRRAFSLVEMLVALGVTSLLMVMMFRMFMDSTAIWQKNEERLDTFREARAALQLMARELATVNAVPHVPDQFPVLALRHHSATAAADKVNEEVYALASVPNRGRSDLCAIGYYCGWDPQKKTFILRRQCVDSDATFTRLRQALSAGAPLGGPAAFKLLFARPQPLGDEEPIQDVASFVWDLQFAVPHPNPLGTAPPPPWPQGHFSRELPQWLEIRFKALGATAARKLEGQEISRETWFDPRASAYQRLILPSEQQFVTRVKLAR